MSILSSIMSSGVSNVVKEVGNIVDELNTSTEEKAKLKIDLEKVFNERLSINYTEETNLRSEITKRWGNDSNGDVTLAKLIRPVTLMLWTVILIGIMTATIFMSIEPTQLETLTVWMPLIQTIVVTIYTAYFGGRSLEKIISINKDKNKSRDAIEYMKTIDTTRILKEENEKGAIGKYGDSTRKDIDDFLS